MAKNYGFKPKKKTLTEGELFDKISKKYEAEIGFMQARYSFEMDNFGAVTEATQADLKALIDKIKAEGQAQS